MDEARGRRSEQDAIDRSLAAGAADQHVRATGKGLVAQRAPGAQARQDQRCGLDLGGGCERRSALGGSLLRLALVLGPHPLDALADDGVRQGDSSERAGFQRRW